MATRNTNYRERVYPKWFIDEIVNEEDKERARDGSLKSTEGIEFKCDGCGNVYRQSICNHIKLSTGEKKKGCPICGRKRNIENRMKNISIKRSYPEWFIDEIVNEEDKEKAINGTLTSKSKVEFRCDECGNVYEQLVYNHIKLSNGERKQGCPICGKTKKTENRVKTISSKRVYPQWFIDELVNEEDKNKARNGTLMNRSKVKFKCDNGHIYEQAVSHHIRISTGEKLEGCPICGKLKNHENRMNTISSRRIYPQWFIEELVNEEDKERAENGTLMSRSKVEFKCDKGHLYKQSVVNHIEVSSGNRKKGCPICGKTKKIENLMINISSKRVYPQWFIDELVNEEDKIKAEDGTLMNRSKVEFRCDKGHVYKQRVYDHIKISTGKKSQGCPICTHFRSKPELEIEEYVKELGYNTEHKRFRDSNHKLFEVDISIPEKNVGIEYNGSVYHSSENGVYKNLDRLYHYNKFNECRKKGILLITIFDIEWDNRKEEIKQYIVGILEGKETNLSYEREGYMNNNYPCWKHYKDSGDHLEDSYTYNGKNIVYTCGYSMLA